MMSKTSSVILIVVLAAITAPAQQAAKVCPDGRTIKIVSQWDQLTETMTDIEAAALPLHYYILTTQDVQGAWIEVWDRPKQLSRQAVSIRSEGEASCTNCLAAEVTPEELHVSIFDPKIPLLSDQVSEGPAGSGDYVSEVRAGKKPDEDSDESDEPAYLIDYPALTGTPIRILEGSGSTSVVLSGENLISSSRVYLAANEAESPGSKPSRDYLYSRTLDLRHIQVTIPAFHLEKAGVLTAYSQDAWERNKVEKPVTGQQIVVASKDSPVIDSVEPRVLRPIGSGTPIILKGSGFTEDSEVRFGDELSTWAAQVVSPRELHFEIPEEKLDDSLFGVPTAVTMSVINDPLHISAPVTVPVVPSAKSKRQRLPAVISAIEPYPIPMMDFDSPGFLILEIDGDNFRSDDIVSIHHGYHDYKRLRTKYVSGHHLKAWLPRELWSQHRLSFRLVVQTSAGFCAAEAFAK